jgi:hypothetical protein
MGAQVRLRHTTSTGRPIHGASTSRTVRRPWLWAITPQTRQPSCRGDDSTTTRKDTPRRSRGRRRWPRLVRTSVHSRELLTPPRVEAPLKLSCRVAIVKRMTIQRLENVGIVVDDLAAATRFFVELGLKVLVRGRLRAVGWTVWRGSRASAWTSRCWRLRTAMDGSN